MAYEERALQTAVHNIILEGREKLAISGVLDVGSYDENIILLSTTRGDMTLRGSNLHIEKLSLDSGDLVVRGIISEMSYVEPAATGSFWSRLFK